MRFFKGLLMLLIGMIGFTALASTPVTEQKQKVEIVKVFKAQTIVDIVLTNDYNLVTHTKYLFQEPMSVFLRNGNDQVSLSFAIITDVGWQSFKPEFKEIPYTEKLQENYNINFRYRIENPNNQIRDNC